MFTTWLEEEQDFDSCFCDTQGTVYRDSFAKYMILEAMNASLAAGMCPQSQWEKVTKGSWARAMSPFDHKFLHIRTAGSTLENFKVSTDEEVFAYRIVLLVLGIILMSTSSFVSKSLVFYYSSAMAIGIILVVLIVLYQGMKLLPTGRKSSLAIFIYSFAVGFGGFLLHYSFSTYRARN